MPHVHNTRRWSVVSGPVAGATMVVLEGAMFEHGLAYTCRFGESSVAAEFNRSSQHVAVGMWRWAHNGPTSCPRIPSASHTSTSCDLLILS